LVGTLAVKLLRYGVWIGAGLTIFYLSQNADIFIAGRVIRRTADIGFYTTSWNLAFLAAGLFGVVSSSMVFPALSRLQDDPRALEATLLKSLRQVGAILFPASALLAAVAPVLIVPLLGDKFAQYRASWLVLSLLTIYAGNRTMLAVFFEGYKAVGKPWLVPAYNAVKLAVIVPAMVVGAQHGILGLAVTYIPIQLVEIPLALGLARKVLAVAPRAVLRAVSIPLLSSLLMAALVSALELLLSGQQHAPDPSTVTVCCFVAPTVYLGAIWLLGRPLLAESRDVLLRGL
jgi:PST family polysaccharide transporter